ncbi:MAG: hypothetical protein HW389_1643 [Bacteroidetes bacterium]|nr:hypothetical protein [Bacteroidota bacterium]
MGQDVISRGVLTPHAAIQSGGTLRPSDRSNQQLECDGHQKVGATERFENSAPATEIKSVYEVFLEKPSQVLSIDSGDPGGCADIS